MKFIIPVGIIIALALIAILFVAPKFQKINPTTPIPTQQTSQDQTVNIKAKFAIFTNGTLRIFTDPRYHNLNEEIYIEASAPNEINVKKTGKTWNDFFATLPMKLDKNCLTTGTGQLFCTNENQTLKFYINKKLDPNALDKQINQDDELLVSYGSESESEINSQFLQTSGL